MRKSIIKIVVLSLALLLCLSVMIVAMATTDSEAAGVIYNMTYKDADLYTAGGAEYQADAVSALKINYRVGIIKVVGYDGDTVRLEEEGADSEKNTVHTRCSLGTLFVQFGESRVSFFERLPNKTLTVYVPEELSSIEIETASADTTLEGVRAARLEIDTASGGVTATESVFVEAEIDSASGVVSLSADIGKLEVDAASGAVSVAGNVGELHVDTASGNIALAGKFDKVELDTASGDAALSGEVKSFEMETASGDVILASAPTRISFESASGDITVRLPKGTEGVSAVHDRASGDMTVIKDGKSYEGKRYSDSGVINHEFEFETASGDVEIIFEN